MLRTSRERRQPTPKATDTSGLLAATKLYASNFVWFTVFICILAALGVIQAIAFIGTLFGTGDAKRATTELFD